MTVAEQLLVACLRDRDNKTLSLIQKKWLDDVSELKQYNYIMNYYKEYGELVGLKTYTGKFKLDSSMADAKGEYYLKTLKDRYIFSVISEEVPKILKRAKDDPREKLAELQRIVVDLSVDAVESNDCLYSDDVELRKKEYEDRMTSLGVTYLSMGCEDLDKTFYGFRKQDLITIGGRAGQGKSWLLVYWAYLVEQVIKTKRELGESIGDILFITNEMGEEEIKERLDCLRWKLPYANFLSGTLTKRERRRYYNGLESLGKEKSPIRIVYSCTTIEELQTYIGLYQPSVVFIDGSYIMEGQLQEGWEKIVYITRNLKRISKKSKVPIVNTTQLKRGAGKSSKGSSFDGQDEFAYSGSYTQDSDLAWRMFQTPDMLYHDMVGLETVKGRRVKAGTVINFQNNLDSMLHSITLEAEPTKDIPTEETIGI